MTPAGETSAHCCRLSVSLPTSSLTCKATRPRWGAGRLPPQLAAVCSSHAGDSARITLHWSPQNTIAPEPPQDSLGTYFQPFQPPGNKLGSIKVREGGQAEERDQRETKKEGRGSFDSIHPQSQPQVTIYYCFVWKLRGERFYWSRMFCSSTNQIMLYLLISEHMGLSYIEFNWCKLELQYVRFQRKHHACDFDCCFSLNKANRSKAIALLPLCISSIVTSHHKKSV